MNDFYDALETRDGELREREQFSKLRALIAHAKAKAPYFGRALSDVEPADIGDRAALAKLPVTRKSDFTELQQKDPPFAGMLADPVGGMARVFMSPGPVFDPQARRPDFWRLARALHAAGFRAGDLVHNTFSYHFTPAGFMLDEGAQALGCAVFPGGVGQTDMQVTAIAGLKPNAYTGTPSFLRIILEKADELKADATSIRKAVVSGEALPPSLRGWFEERGISTLQCYAIADVGLVGYESSAKEGLVIDEGVIVEIVRPGTGDPVAAGEVGEVLVTLLEPEYPLVRFATGDLSATLAGTSPCGRTNMRIKGWMGRADQTAKVKGMFVKPTQLAQLAARHAEIRKYRLTIDHDEKKNDRMTLHCEVDNAAGAVNDAIATSLRAICNLRGDVVLKAPGTLPDDGKVIEDLRRYE